jgi:hypothetical protein
VVQFEIHRASILNRPVGNCLNEEEVKPRGPWQAIGMQEARLEKGSPEKLRIRARELRGHAARLSNEADELFARADEIEAAQKKHPREDFSQAAARIVREATETD